MARFLLTAFSLILVSMSASADMKLTVKVSINTGPTITVSNVSEEDLKSGKLKEILSVAAKQAKPAWYCLAGRGRC